jgi:hypothetical protein
VFGQLRLPAIAGWVRLRGHGDANLPRVRLGGFRSELHAMLACARLGYNRLPGTAEAHARSP